MNNIPQEIIDAVEHWSNYFDINNIIDCQYLLLFIKDLLINSDKGYSETDNILLEKITKILYHINEESLENNLVDIQQNEGFNNWNNLKLTEQKVIPKRIYYNYIIPNRKKTYLNPERHY